MNLDQNLDRLLHRLRDATPAGVGLDQVERGVWQQIEQRAAGLQRPKLRLTFLLTSVTAAFVWGVFSGAGVAESAPTARAFLVEEVDLLPPDLGLPL